jgi:hypothetical protein
MNCKWDSAGKLVSKGDTVVMILAENGFLQLVVGKYSKAIADEVYVIEKTCIKVGKPSKVFPQGGFMFRIDSDFENHLLANILSLLGEILEEINKPEPNLNKFKDKIFEIVNSPDEKEPDQYEETEEEQ